MTEEERIEAEIKLKVAELKALREKADTVKIRKIKGPFHLTR